MECEEARRGREGHVAVGKRPGPTRTQTRPEASEIGGRRAGEAEGEGEGEGTEREREREREREGVGSEGKGEGE